VKELIRSMKNFTIKAMCFPEYRVPAAFPSGGAAPGRRRWQAERWYGSCSDEGSEGWRTDVSALAASRPQILQSLGS
jgi:hypothetical protein